MCELWQELIVLKPIGSELEARKVIYTIEIHRVVRFYISLNLYLFSASPQISVAADNNRFYSPVLLFSDQQTKLVNKPYWSLCLGFCSLYTLDLSVSALFPREGWVRAKDDRKLTLVSRAIHLLPSLLCLSIQLSGTQIGVPHDGRKAKKKEKTAANWMLDNIKGEERRIKKFTRPETHCYHIVF